MVGRGTRLTIAHPDRVLPEHKEDLVPYLQKFRSARGEMTYTQERLRHYSEWFDRELKEPGDRVLASWRSRMLTACWKIAMIYTIDTCPEGDDRDTAGCDGLSDQVRR